MQKPQPSPWHSQSSFAAMIILTKTESNATAGKDAFRKGISLGPAPKLVPPIRMVWSWT